MDIKLSDEQKKAIKDEIHRFYLEERDEDIGIIHREGLFDLFMDQLAPMIYNKALDDAKHYFMRRLDDMDADYYELYQNI